MLKDFTKLEIQRFIESVYREYCPEGKIPKLSRIGDFKKGKAFIHQRTITLPTWPLLHSREYMMAYIIHEVCHFIDYDRTGIASHNDSFKSLEREILAKHGLNPQFADSDKAYYSKMTGVNGEVLYDKTGKTSNYHQNKEVEKHLSTLTPEQIAKLKKLL